MLLESKNVKVLVSPLCLTLFHPMYYMNCHALLSMEFSRQEYWSGLPFPFPGDRPYPGIKARSPALQAESLLSELQGSPMAHTRKSYIYTTMYKIDN